ncbi:MAG: hypothetical protein ABI543_05415 [Ignavibacteria bacterium]
MQDTRVISLIKSFSKEDMKSFEKFIASPYFNTVKNNITFFKVLKNFYPDFNDTKFTAEYLFEKLYKGKPFNRQMMWNFTSGFEKLVQEFLTQTSLNKTKLEKYILNIKELESRNLDKHFSTKMDEMGKYLENLVIDNDYYFYCRALEELRISYWQKSKGLQNVFADNLFKSSEFFILDFFIKMFRPVGNLDVYKSKYNIEDKSSLFPEFIMSVDYEKIIEQCKINGTHNAEMIEFFCSIILCIIKSDKEEYFFGAKDFLFKNYRLFDIDICRNTAAVLTYYCILKGQLGDIKYRNLLFEMNEFSLKRGIAFFENGKIGKMLYIQIVNNGLFLGKTDWVINFVKEFTSRLVEEHQNTMRALAESSISFRLKRYNEVLINLNNVVFIDTRDKVHVKQLTAKTLFEMGETDLLLSHIDASKHFLKNNDQFGTADREMYSNFYNYLHKIIIAAEKKDMAGLNIIQNSIKNEKLVNQKNWLLEKIKELLTKPVL